MQLYIYIYTTYKRHIMVTKRREKNDTNNIILYILYINEKTIFLIIIFINKIIKFEKGIGIEI